MFYNNTYSLWSYDFKEKYVSKDNKLFDNISLNIKTTNEVNKISNLEVTLYNTCFEKEHIGDDMKILFEGENANKEFERFFNVFQKYMDFSLPVPSYALILGEHIDMNYFSRRIHIGNFRKIRKDYVNIMKNVEWVK